ncbi:MAG TPA: class I SAM-dependent methyltransferase [Myxococcota bacterium]|nr:class I SAM-dependent methyltransferase [Myxococcota bacterium]HRY95896.1 class I SAM-dependent methyltransferase [Myxococcota bacterium]
MEACATQLGAAPKLAPQTGEPQVHIDLTDPRQRALYDRRYGRTLQRLRSWLRQDDHHRARQLERGLARQGLALRDLKVFELGFGAGELLLRFEPSCSLHGCDSSEASVLALGHDARLARYRERMLALSARDGGPAYPSSGYDVVIASDGLEPRARAAQTLLSLLRHTRPGGLGVFFFDGQAHDLAACARLLRGAGWVLLEGQAGSRLGVRAWDLRGAGAPGPLARLGGAADRVAGALLGLAPAGLRQLCESPLAALRVRPSRLMLVARRPA